MKACPNAQCPYRLQHGSPAPYLMAAVLCRHCAGRVVPVEHLERAERSAPTVPTVTTARKRASQLGEGSLFALGLALVIVPHILAHFVGNIAYSLPVLALAFGLTRLPRRPAALRTPARSALDTTGVHAMPLRFDAPQR